MSPGKERSQRRVLTVGRVLVGFAALLVVFVLFVLWATGTQSGLRTALSLADGALPKGLVVRQANGRLLGPIALNGVALELEGAKVSIEVIEFDWSPARFLREGIHIDRLALSDVALQLEPAAASQDTASELQLPDSIVAPVSLTVERLGITNLSVSYAGNEWMVDQLEASARWAGTQLELDHLSATSALGSVDASGVLQTADRYDLVLNVFVLGVLDGAADVQAQLGVHGDIDQLRATLGLDAPYSTQIATTVDAPLQEPHFLLQLESSPDDLGFSDGTLTLSGTPTDYEFSGEASIEYIDHLDGLTFAGTGTDSSVVLSSLRAEAGDSALTVDATLDWESGLKANGKLRGEALDPSLYLPQLPGALNVQADLRVEQDASGDWTGALTNMLVDGQLVDLPLTISGQIDVDPALLRARAVNVALGESSLVLNGELSEQVDLTWLLEVRDADQFSPIAGLPLAGTVTGGGSLSGALEDFRIDATLRARDVVVDEQLLDTAELTLAGSRRAHDFDIELASPHVDLLLAGRGDFRPDNAWTYALDGLTLSHPDLDTSLVHHEWQLVAPVAGEVSSQRVTSEPICLGHQVPDDGGGLCIGYQYAEDLLSADLTAGNLKLDSINALLPSTARLSGTLAGSLAWRGVLEESTADLSVENLGLKLNSGNGWRDALRFGESRITLAPVDQTLQLDVQFPLRLGASEAADTAAKLGAISSADHSDCRERGECGVFGSATLRPHVNPNQNAGRNGGQNGGFETWPLESQVRFELPNLAFLADFSDLVEEFNGELNGGLSIAGSLDAPALTGSTQLSVHKALIPELGLELQDATVGLKGVDGGLQLSGAMKSGGGDLALDADVRVSDGVALEGTLSGQDFLVIDSPLARAAVSPDLELSFEANRLKIRGDIALPVADIRLAKIPAGAVSASRDQRFVAEEKVPTPLDIDAEVTLLLGDDVRFEGLGLVASFGGELTVSDRSTGVTTGRGEIVIKEGTYKAYGQDLRVDNGKVLFAGGPVDAPGLDVRAVRQATPEVEVGVQVQGSLMEPRLNVFSTPSMPESDQLAYLVLGRPLSSSSASENSLLQQAAMAIGVEGGTLLTEKIGKNLGVDTFGIESAPGTGTAQAALVVGKYLSPRLYVSYGYGLFEPISTLRMEYQLSRLWRIVTESTNRATGGDIFWVHERD